MNTTTENIVTPRHIMVDIETLGTSPGCVIASIGACTFDPETGTVARQTFYDLVDIADAVRAGLVIEPGTVLWWMRQDDASRGELTRTDGRSSLAEALSSFSAWFSEIGADEKTQVWANGASFDFPILEAGFRAVNAPPPWAYWQQRCFRTARKLLPVFEERMQGTKHNALDDAIHQAQQLVSGMRRKAHQGDRIREYKQILQDMHEAWAYFIEYDVPVGMKERIEAALQIGAPTA